jgi:DNA-binding NtrC family response regulator
MKGKLVLIADDDPDFRNLISYWLEKWDYRVLQANDGEECLNLLSQKPNVVLLDILMPILEGPETLREIKRRDENIPVIVLTADQTVEKAVEVMKLGAYDYVLKPIVEDKLRILLQNAVEKYALTKELQRLRNQLQEKHVFSSIVGSSSKMKEIFVQLESILDTDVSVLIHGESGTGKELIAKAIHYNSVRRDGPFVDINCAAIPETLLESELFGHEKGAFTGATDRRQGRFEQAHGGTLFLDEVGEMSLVTQAKILRVIQEKSFDPVGGKRRIQVDVRIITATNKDLEAEVKARHFREDLYYRLAVFPIYLPPLRERREDIPLLIFHFLNKYGQEFNKKITSVSPKAMEALLAHPWRGNIRELENVIQRALILSRNNERLELEVLPRDIQSLVPESSDLDTASKDILVPLQSGKVLLTELESNKILPFDEVEKRVLQHALNLTKGNVSQAAKELGIGRTTLYRKLEKYQLITEKTVKEEGR